MDDVVDGNAVSRKPHTAGNGSRTEQEREAERSLILGEHVTGLRAL